MHPGDAVHAVATSRFPPASPSKCHLNCSYVGMSVICKNRCRTPDFVKGLACQRCDETMPVVLWGARGARVGLRSSDASPTAPPPGWDLPPNQPRQRHPPSLPIG